MPPFSTLMASFAQRLPSGGLYVLPLSAKALPDEDNAAHHRTSLRRCCGAAPFSNTYNVLRGSRRSLRLRPPKLKPEPAPRLAHLISRHLISLPDNGNIPGLAAWQISAFPCGTTLSPRSIRIYASRVCVCPLRVAVDASERAVPAMKWAFGDVNPPVPPGRHRVFRNAAIKLWQKA